MNGFDFEKEVLRVARHLWSTDVSGGAEFIDGRERDAVFYEEDVIHLIEATTERSEDKAKNDCKKLSRLASDLRKKHQDKVVKCWFITNDEPTDRQRAVARGANYPIQAIGFKEFQGKLIDAREYLSARSNHKFGSVHNPANCNDDLKFIPVDVKERAGFDLWSIAEIAESLISGKRIALTADFGAGKSMIMRELFFFLKNKYLSGAVPYFPIHINLREHSGAQFPDEILERHARVIGFNNPAKLVRAWRAGYVILLLDGFDEITSLGFQGRWTKLRDLRYRALGAVRELIAQQPAVPGSMVAGREYYFDSYSELRKCLGLSSTVDLTLNDFTEEQVATLLSNLGISSRQVAPAWLPKRPLFVATLALRGYLADLRGGHDSSVGEGWNELIGSICDRESNISIGLDSQTIRQVLERVATIARGHSGASGLSQVDLVRAFTEICGYLPDEQGLLLLERLPGLGISVSGSEDRTFVDSDFECALGVGDLCRFLVEPWLTHGPITETVRPLSSVGFAVGRAILFSDERARHAQPALERARAFSCITFDLLQLARELKASIGTNISISDIHIGHLDISGDLDDSITIYFNDCIVDLLDVELGSKFVAAAKLQGCLVRSIGGVHAKGDLPAGFIDERCDIDEYTDNVASNAAILEADLPLPVRVLLVVLRKLYFQAGAARRENAFYRGLDNNAQRYVSDVLDVLGSEGLAARDRRGGEPLIVPTRGEMKRIASILSAPETSQDPLVIRVRKLA